MCCWSVVGHPVLLVVCCLSFVRCRSLFVVRCLSFVVRWPLSLFGVVYRLWLVVCWSRVVRFVLLVVCWFAVVVDCCVLHVVCAVVC